MPFCKKTESILGSLLDKYRGRVKLAYMDFPLREIHPRAESAAEASRCAGEQGKFWEFHDSLFADATKLEDSDLVACGHLACRRSRSGLASPAVNLKAASIVTGRRV